MDFCHKQPKSLHNVISKSALSLNALVEEGAPKADEGWRGVSQLLTIADKGGGGV